MASKENQEAFNKVYGGVSMIQRDNKCGFFEAKEIREKASITLQQAINRLELVEKALDKACERLSETYPKYDFSDKECLVRKILVPKEEWKEALLKESENDNGK